MSCCVVYVVCSVAVIIILMYAHQSARYMYASDFFTAHTKIVACVVLTIELRNYSATREPAKLCLNAQKDRRNCVTFAFFSLCVPDKPKVLQQ